MLYSICSMPFWINKSNLVCADQGWSLVSVIWIFCLGGSRTRLLARGPSSGAGTSDQTTWLVWAVGWDLDIQKWSCTLFVGWSVFFFLPLILDACRAHLRTELVRF